MKINENLYKIDFFRIHSVLNVDFDESYAFLIIILNDFARILNDFQQFWRVFDGLGLAEPWKWRIFIKKMKINDTKIEKFF